jgi:hypothetical protein
MKKNFKTIALLLKVVVFLILVISCKENKSGSNITQSKHGVIENNTDIQYKDKEKFDIAKHLKGNSFTLNGNGNVNFNIFSSENGSIMINGNGNRLEGTIKITSNSSFSVRDLLVTGGNYDATNNRGSNGVFIVNSNGDLSGTLRDRNGNSRSITFNMSK